MKKTWTWSVTSGPLLGRSHTEIQDICKQAGSGIEAGMKLFGLIPEAELETLGEDYRSAGVRIETFHLPFTPQDDLASFYETVRQRAVETAVRGIERGAALGASVGIQHPSMSTFSVDNEGLDPFMRQLGKSLKTLLDVAEKNRFTIAIENMGAKGRLGGRPEHFERLKQEFDHPNLGFCLDSGHALMALGPERAGEFFDVMAPKIVAFHLADNAGDRDSHLAPGHGLVDWTGFFRRVSEIQFSRAMCIETPPFAPGPDYRPEAWKEMVADVDALARAALSEPS